MDLPVSGPAVATPIQPRCWATRVLRSCATLAFLGWALAPVSLSLQFHAGVQDTLDWAWVPIFGIGCLGSLLLIPMPLLVPRPRRLEAAVLGMLGTTLPLVLTILFVVYLLDAHRRRHIPDQEIHRIGRMAAVTVLRWSAQSTYPFVKANERLIMHYDKNVQEPYVDLASMSRFLEDLEKRTGRRQTAPIRWVRGPVLGLENLCVNNLALGSDCGPARPLDRHELAHAFSFQFWDRRHQPPTILIEGFAMAAEKESRELALRAKESRSVFAIWKKSDQVLPLLMGPEFYEYGTPFAYDFGGSLVDFLLRKYGPERFVKLFNESTQGGMERTCQEIFGRSLVELEKEWWADVEAMAKAK